MHKGRWFLKVLVWSLIVLLNRLCLVGAVPRIDHVSNRKVEEGVPCASHLCELDIFLLFYGITYCALCLVDSITTFGLVDIEELEFTRKVGSGSFGAVWEAHWRGMRLAAKVLERNSTGIASNAPADDEARDKVGMVQPSS